MSSLSELINVGFDKPRYYPGDKVRVHFYGSGSIPTHVRKITLEVKSYEEVFYDYGSGDDSELVHEIYVFNRVKKEISITTPAFTVIDEELDYVLPDDVMPPEDTNEVKIKHVAVIHYDRVRRFDKKQEYPIPYAINFETLNPKPVFFTEKGYNIKVSKDIIFPGDAVTIEFNSFEPVNVRSIRVELVQQGRYLVNHYKKNRFTHNVLLEKMHPTNFFSVNVIIPRMKTLDYHGKNYEVKTFIKVVLDKKFMFDKRFLVPLRYYHENDSQEFT